MVFNAFQNYLEIILIATGLNGLFEELVCDHTFGFNMLYLINLGSALLVAYDKNINTVA